MSIDTKIKLNAPMFVANTQAGPTNFSDERTGISITWEGKGNPAGLDVQACPLQLLENTDFIRNLSNGVFVIEQADAEVMEIVEAQLSNPYMNRSAAVWRQQQADRLAGSQAEIEHKENQDYIVQGCIGPSTRGEGTCGAQVPVKDQNSKDAPPLCSQHKSLALSFVAHETETINPDTGKAEVLWAPVKFETRR